MVHQTKFTAKNKDSFNPKSKGTAARRRDKLAGATRALLESLENRTLFSTLNFVVNTLSPSSSSPTATSGGIVDAVNAANADTTDTAVSISFDSSVFTGVARTITLTSGLILNPTNTGLLVTIDATSAGGVTIDGGGTAIDLSLSAGTTNLTDLTLTNGFASDGQTGNGGGIANSATLNLTNCTISGNMANGAGDGSGGGGGIYNSGTLTIQDSTISGNTAFGSVNGAAGGGIFDGGTLTLTNSTVANNASANNGGGICFAAGSHATLVNDTITGNGILSFGAGAGIYNGSGSAISMTNTIVASNAANGDFAFANDGSNFTGSFDIIGDSSSLSNLTNSQNNQYPANLPLAPLNYYGGPTQTIALLGTPFVGTSTGAPTTDQRGFARGGGVDIGAYQSQTTADDFLVTTANDPGVPGLMSLRGAINLANLQTSNVAITFASAFDIQMTVPTTLFLNNSNANVTISVNATSVGGVTVSGGGALSNFSDIEIDNGTVSLADLTITNGNTSNSGGGVYNNSTLALTNCTFTNDSAGEEGGGVYNEDNLTVVNCTFTNNSANYGGGLFNNATLNMSDTSISNNSLTGTGGGAGLGNEGEATITNCTITDNAGTGSGDVGGGILNYYLMTITGGAITGNSSAVSGGGIEDQGTALSATNCIISNNTSANGGGVHSQATTTITSCQLTGNISTATGGGISDASGSTVNVDRTTLSGNSATGNGGGIFNLGTLTVANSTLSANVSAADGGGLAHQGGTSDIVNSTLSGNTDGGGGGLGGGIAALATGVSVMDSTLSGNSASSSGGGIYMANPALLVNSIVANSPHGSDLAGGAVAAGSINNLIDDAATGSGLTNGVGGNIIDHPALLGALGSNGGPTQTMSLLPGSLARNAGTPLALTTLGASAASTDTTLTLTAGTTVAVGLYLRIDNEIVLITGIPSSTSLTVLRGQLGTTAAAHQSGASLILATDQRGIARSVLAPNIGAVDGTPPIVQSPPTVVSFMPAETTSSVRPTLSILGLDPNTGNDSDLTYTWSVALSPSGAKAVKFSENGTNAAKAATARFQKAGTYHLLCTISNGNGGTTTQSVSITIKQIATSLRLTPHAQIIAASDTLQYGATAMDQFGQAMRTTPTTAYAVNSGDGTISDAGLFSAGKNRSHVVIQITDDGLLGTVGATIS